MIASIKTYLVEIVAALALVGGVWITHAVMSARLETAQNALHEANVKVDALTLAAKARDAGDAVRERQMASNDRKLKETQDALQKALAANPQWAGTAVPRAVLDSLRDSADH